MTDNLFAQVGKSSRSGPNFGAHRPLTIIFFLRYNIWWSWEMAHELISSKKGANTKVRHTTTITLIYDPRLQVHRFSQEYSKVWLSCWHSTYSAKETKTYSPHRDNISMQTQHGSRSYAVHSKTSGDLPSPQIKRHAMSRDSEVWRFRRLFNSPSGDLPGISPISSLKRVSWQLQVDQKTKTKGRRKRGSDPGLKIDQGEKPRWWKGDFFFGSRKLRPICKAICTYGKETAPTFTGLGFLS